MKFPVQNESHPGWVPRPSLSASPGYALVLVLVILSVLAIMASALVPNLVRQTLRRQRHDESVRLPVLAQGLRQSIHRTQTIPGITNWIRAIAAETGFNTSEVAQVYSASSEDANTRRVFLIHPGFTPGYGPDLLPYEQFPEGIPLGDTNAPGADSRVMILSNTRRELVLPYASGVPTAGDFEAVWEWTHDPATRNPPPGWPPAWNGRGDALQVARLNLNNDFHVLTLSHLQYSLDGSAPRQTILTTAQRHFLRGSHLELFLADGRPHLQHIINKDAVYDLYTGPPIPLLHYALEETSGSLTTNLGSAGAAGDATHQNGVVPGLDGPRPPSFPNFESDNRAVGFDGKNDHSETSYHLPSPLPGFTLAGWIYPTAKLSANTGIFGERDVVYIESRSANTLRFFTLKGLWMDVPYPYGQNEWHHIAATADGAFLRFYVDGIEVGNKADPTADYGNPASSTPFRMGGRVNLHNKYSEARVDEVVVFGRALYPSEIAQLADGTIFEE